MDFAKVMEKESKKTVTENGQMAMNTTGNPCVDFFSLIGALRNANETRIETLFEESYATDPLLAVKTVFYGRDREALGERRVFRVLLKYIANNYPEALISNLDLIGLYGRYDDLYSLIGTKLESEMWEIVKRQLEKDIENDNNNNPVSLLAKWLKSADASSVKTKRLGIYTAQKLGYSTYDYKRIVKKLRKRIKVVESLMSNNEWDEIKYSNVPSRAMALYRNAFIKHDENRFNTYLDDVIKGNKKINSATLYPYDILRKMIYTYDDERVLEAQWNQLPNYIEKGSNAIVMADTSGSMYGTPMATAIGLAIYFAERNIGAYHNLWLSFSANPHIHKIVGKTLRQKLNSIDMTDWDMNTDLIKALRLILNLAVKNQIPNNEMVKSFIIISDMEIDECTEENFFYDQIKNEYESNGYNIPNIVFWNVNSRHNVFHGDANRQGIQLVSGASPSVFKYIIDSINKTPYELMIDVLNSKRYDCIKIEKAYK